MYDHKLHSKILTIFSRHHLQKNEEVNFFYTRFISNVSAIQTLFKELYGNHPLEEKQFDALLNTLTISFIDRSSALKKRDRGKIEADHWFLSNALAGMSLYVDRFCESLNGLEEKFPYLKDLGINVLHLMPLFESPDGESDGGYAVSDFRKINPRFGTLQDLQDVQQKMLTKEMYLMIDIVLNHTSHRHEWALRAKAGEKEYQDFFYMYDDRHIPDQFEKTMPEIFPQGAPGNFTWIEECQKWVMTVFHNFQWDLNYRNPKVFVAMLDTILFYANLGVDILRIDAPAFIWKQIGTKCQNLPEAHKILQLIKLCVQVTAPGMALLGEAIVAPGFIMDYFGTGSYLGRECDFTYNATQMALQWDALATADTKVMLAAQSVILRKPYGTSWITYTRCHDDIGLGYDDYMIEQAGYNAYEHRQFLKNYYSGSYPGSPAQGALFSFNPKTGDARISGTLASLCGLETALENDNEATVSLSIDKILMMQAMSFFIGGLPMLFYGDEVGYLNDHNYQCEEGKSYDNRWMHRPVIDWRKNSLKDENGTVEERIFSGTKRLLELRTKLAAVADLSNLTWITPHNIHIAGFIRSTREQQIYCLFNFANEPSFLTWYAFREKGGNPQNLHDHWTEKNYMVGEDHEYLIIKPYGFHILEEIK
jgi:amylosucrase